MVSNASDRISGGHKFKSQLYHITFVEIDYEIISMVPSADSRKLIVS